MSTDEQPGSKSAYSDMLRATFARSVSGGRGGREAHNLKLP